MDKNQAALAAMALLLILSASGIVYFLDANSSLARKVDDLNRTSQQQLAQARSDYSALNGKYAASQQQLASTGALLEAETARLALTQARLSEADAALNESRASLATQQQKVAEISANLTSLEASINESLAWFQDNAYMPKNYSWAADIFMKRVPSDCVDGSGLNLACVSYLMENTAFAIHYRTGGLPGNPNHFKGVKGTIDQGWGDCKDYSLLFKAILNSMRLENRSLAAVAWQPADSGEFRIYPKETPGETGPYWAYVNAKAAPMGTIAYSYVTCYTVDEFSGHCVVAISPVQINSSSQAPLLEGAQVFEPQSGRYLGKIGGSLSMCSQQGCKQQGGKIWFVISDSDTYLYGENGWQGYADSLAQVQAEMASLPK